jgi:hypothetical protein
LLANAGGIEREAQGCGRDGFNAFVHPGLQVIGYD